MGQSPFPTTFGDCGPLTFPLHQLLKRALQVEQIERGIVHPRFRHHRQCESRSVEVEVHGQATRGETLPESPTVPSHDHSRGVQVLETMCINDLGLSLRQVWIGLQRRKKSPPYARQSWLLSSAAR